ncbi:ankyrin repeat and IBR domain-containing protein 1-like [Mercenaria mercenaria]|uniref:ankyrin repeat and IBR domain-containing protein 1-like n=1 Tax=Mercenaria mercenaria TaxID=6596 RepID=UPI00234E8D82|nr:ankyrin repeat and IBR domain-containing protein 1-like [Mercenaria mercenaria]
MGSSSSKFRKHLQNGDEVAALNVYNNHSDLRKGLDPNCSYGDNFQHETPLHFAARHGMKSLLRIFLFEHCGNPNKTNGKKETALHCVCMEKNPQYYPVQRRRLECLNMMLQWRGAELKDGEIEKVDLAAVDEQNNTALHYAALSGLKACVENLVNHSCPLFVENTDNQTPCDCAESKEYNEIALYLESKMVFSNDGTTDEIEEVPPQVDSEEYSGLRAQDLQEAKDQLLVETADMLSIPLFTAEALLRNHEWSREMLLDAWMSDPVACCEKSGVTPPANLFSEKPVVAESLSTPTMTHPPSSFAECDICTLAFEMHDAPVHMSCHQFCRECWEGYLNVKIQEGGVHDITCPGFDCNILVPVEHIENVVSRDMARRYLQFDIKAFVDSNPNIKWCPFPGCGRAVKLPEMSEGATASGVTSPRHSKIPNDTSRAVDCGNGHYFCWECVGEAHEPCSCESLQKWMGEIKDIRPETLNGTETETETAANCLWLVTNSKSCPNCKSPIQKNEGCNHMKCSKCKYDFCWVCLDQWKRHNSSTGGYFKCNRYEVSKKVDDTTKQAVVQAVEKNTKMQELNKFVHYYTRYKNHENSYKLEEPLLKTAKEKMLKLAEAVTDLATAKDETKFVEEAVNKLLKARRVLKYSYVYGYYLDGPPYRKIVFEFMQTELEECTEILSQMVNRLYLRTPRKKIIEQSQICHRKRLEFLTAISKGLVPPETPPGLRKKRRKYSMDTEDEDLRKAILASIEDFDPQNPWIVDASGRHTNIAALLDWPSDDSDDSDDEQRQSNDQGSPSAESQPENCLRDGCTRSRAKNPRTGELHNFCSLRCSRLHKQRKEDVTPNFSEIQLDEQMDFLRAIEMSRLQYLKEQGVISDDSRSDLTSSGEVTQIKDTPDTADIYTPAERLDIEIKRLLELSSLGTEDIDEAERKLSNASLPEPLSEVKSVQQFSRFGENQSTIVSRVPNKSVEDLYHPDCNSCQSNQTVSPLTSSKHVHHRAASQGRLDLENLQFDGVDLESLGACGGVDVDGTQSRKNDDADNQTAVDDIRIEGPIMQKLLNMDKIDSACSETAPSASSSFGVIKDISVSNILVEDDDKTRHFAKKDFSNLAKNKSKNVQRGNGRLFAANTPGEDEKVFSLISPESDFSESSSSEVWGYRPQPVTDPVQTQTPETDSSIDGCSYADLPNQNMYYKHDDSANENSPIIAEETKLENVIGPSSYQSANQISISEMTENLLQMTLDMQDKLYIENNTQSEQTAIAAEDIKESSSHESPVDDTPPSGHNSNQEQITLDTSVHIPQSVLLENEGNNDCSVIDLDQSEALSHFDQTVVSMETNNRSRETTIGREANNSEETESRSTFV